METVNLWESGLNSHFCFTNKLEDVLEMIKKGYINSYLNIKDTFTPGDDITCMIDSIANKKNIIYNYTDNDHLVAYSKDGYGCFINSSFFIKYKEDIKQAITKKIISSDNTILTIPDWLYNDTLFQYIIEKKNIDVTFKDIILDSEKIKLLQENRIDAYQKIDGVKTQISTSKVFSYYKKEDLEAKDELSINVNDLKKENIDNLVYLPNEAIIIINQDQNIKEEDSLQLTKIILGKLDKLNKNFKVKFEIKKRSSFNKVFDKEFPNLSLIIQDDLYDYSYQEYKEEEKKLNSLISHIKNTNMTPLEKYLAVYNIVKNFKPYKENNDDKIQARSLRYILNNDYMVCVGYAKLLVELLDKVEINAKEISVDVDISYDNGFSLEEKKVDLEGHARVIVSIDDDKYNVHGLYIADPTWDNSLNNNLLNHALMTYDKMQIENRMFKYDHFNVILDIHNFKEFNDQVNYLLKFRVNILKKVFSDRPFIKVLLETYKSVCKNIIRSLETENIYESLKNDLNSCQEEKDYITLLTKIGNYLLTRVNKKIPDDVILKASMESIRKTRDYEEDRLKEIENKTKEEFEKGEISSFPYEITNDSNFNIEIKKR